MRLWIGGLPFIALHFVPLLALLPGVHVRPIDWVVCGALYVIRMFGVTGVYHRYFSHRTYKTSRWFQFVLALLAMSSAQKGVLWWAAHHRHHHKHSDGPLDIHSPVQKGFWYAHVGWIFDGTEATDYAKIKDFARYPELMFLNKFWWIPPTLLGVGVWLALGWSGLLIGFALSTVLLWHGTYTINSLTHVFGKRVYETTDDSRNSFILALITLGEGWHNNHHYYQASTRQGFHWWQLDITYAMLRVLSMVGLIWDIREPPAAVVAGTWRPNKRAAQPASASVTELDEAA
ncbi:Fatty acid desaturase [Enhygromyxa salina]|uniref:Fatty acid desaturase n=1 Tax=Enhygromyxa salina TaxID=215803 RepID=A0A0C1ZXM1_9BACT|nr:acyl-CoA desaturase [Enhygromyxa salina]KIG15923.1 Fatty acid desaturase [Enhygromyxa salina]